MSDLLSRLAARAVGELRAAVPRLPEPFEEPAAAAAIEAHAEAAAAAPVESPSAAAPRQPVAEARPAAPVSEEPDRATRVSETSVSETRQQDVPARTARLATVARPVNVASPDEPSASEPVRAPAEAPRFAERHEAARVPPATAAPIARARPAATPEPVVRTIVDQGATRVEPDTVRVHIGRLEVRANLAPPPSRPRAEAPRRRDELELADYLRGRR